ncbi:MAG TPA: serine protease [bacterium]|jgi:hypothetical protein
MPAVDHAALLREDEQLPKEERNRFALAMDVNLNLGNSGVWSTLPNGDRVWRLRISSPQAYSIGLVYNHWFIPKGGQLWIYNDNHSQVIGSFTSFNNWTDGTNITQPVSGDAVTLEYLEPRALRGQSVLAIFQVCHAYRNLFGPPSAAENFGDSGPCNVNINCPAGSTLQNYKHGVAMIINGGSRWCTGSLINNTTQNGTPYFLTANHCLDGNQGSWVFVFNYESPACSPNTDGPTNQTISNATLLAHNLDSDFALLQLSSGVPASYSPFFNGWDNRDLTWTHSYNISHPSGDVKKLAIDNDAVTSSTWSGTPANSHWQIGAYDVGTTEPGSSGSPLFDLNFHISGQLHGGPAACNNPTGSDYYGKFSMSWARGGTPATELRDWLDPPNTTSVLNGAYINPPGNDVCPGFTIFGLPYTDNGSTSTAHADYPHLNGDPSPDVLYTLYPLTCTSTVTASLCSGTTNFDTRMEIRTGGSCPGSSLVAYDDDFCGFPPGYSQTTFTATAGVQYYIMIYGYSANSGNYTLNVTGTPTAPVPPNDACPGASITSLPYTNSGSTCTATANYTGCVTASSPDVVYTLNIPSCQTVTVSTCGSNFDTQLSIYAGGACPGEFLVACNDDNYCGPNFTVQSTATFVAQGNTNYYILIGGYNGETGNYTLNVTGTPFTPPNDVCPGTSIASLPYSDFGNTGCATHDYSVACRVTTSPDVVYNFTPAACESLTVSLCGSGYDCLIDVRAGGSCPGAVSVACDDDYACPTGNGLQSQVTFRAYAGVTYYFIVSGFNGNAGPFVINVSAGAGFTPSNDTCPGTTIAGLPFTDINSTTCDTHNYPNFQGNTSPDAVYNFTSATCQNVSVSLCGSGYDTGLSVYRNGACPGTTLVAGNDDNLCGGIGTLQSTLGFQASAGVTYYILVHGYFTYSGPFVLNVTGTPCGTTAAVDSLVIAPAGTDVYLQWKFQGPAYKYYIYRATSPTGLVAPANRIDSTTNYYYYDSNVLNTPATKYFYAVSAATLPTLLLADGSEPNQTVTVDKATAAAASEPFFAADPYPAVPQPDVAKPAETSMPQGFYLPAYDQFNTHYKPDPAKAKVKPTR